MFLQNAEKSVQIAHGAVYLPKTIFLYFWCGIWMKLLSRPELVMEERRE